MTTDADPLCGIDGHSLAFVEEFIDSINDNSIEDEDRVVRKHHPLVFLIETSLEAITTKFLEHKLLGVNESTVTEIRAIRRKHRRSKRRHVYLMDDSASEPFDLLLFAYENVIDNINEAMYEARDSELDEMFFTELFPEWLDSLREWATAMNCDELVPLLTSLCHRYAFVATDVVP